METNTYAPTQQDIALAQSNFMTKVYGWMSLALFLTALTSLYVVSSETMIELVFSNRFVFMGLLLGELGLVMAISAAIGRISSTTATILFIIYAVANGLTLSVIFLVYTAGSIATTFMVTAGTFGAMSLYGYTTKKDLTSWGSLLFMALIGLVLASIVNLFFQNEILYWVTTYAGVLIFVGLTAYDTQKIKEMSMVGHADAETERKGAILGALTLYLDFVNLFLYLLRLFGRKK